MQITSYYIMFFYLCLFYSFIITYLYLEKKKTIKDHLETIDELEDLIDKNVDKITEAEKKVTSLENDLKASKNNPDGTLEALNDLVNNKNVILSISRIDPSSIFLRSPKG